MVEVIMDEATKKRSGNDARWLASTVWTIFLFAACSSGSSKHAIEAALTAQIQTDSKTVNLAKVGPDSWDRVCILGPYSDNKMAGRVLGVPWDLESHYADLSTNEGVQVLVFLSDRGDVVASSEHSRGAGDFVSLEGQCLHRSESQLSKRVDSTGRVLIERS